jgi:outer membrane protein OmpA-like peptidoglycan-associated protein
VTLLDEAGDVVTSNENGVLKTWSNQPLVNGVLDIVSLGVADTGTRPSIEITSSDNAITGSMLAALSASVTYVGDAPQLCFALEAITTCPNLQLLQGDTSVPDGIIEVSTATTPSGGTTTRASLRKVIDGTNTVTVCAASTATFTSIPGGAPVISSPGVAPIVEAAPIASVTRPPVYKYIYGFADGSPVLTSKIKNSIRAFLNKYDDYSKIQVVGYTEGPNVLKTDKWLSKTRAQNAMSFVSKKLKLSFTVSGVGASQMTKESSKMRRIKIILTD